MFIYGFSVFTLLFLFMEIQEQINNCVLEKKLTKGIGNNGGKNHLVYYSGGAELDKGKDVALK